MGVSQKACSEGFGLESRKDARIRSAPMNLRVRLAARGSVALSDRPRLLSRSCAASLLLVLLCATGAPAASGAREPTAAEAIALLNQQRAANGLPAGVVEDPALSAGCALHMNYIRLNGELTHNEDPAKPGYTDAGAYAGSSSVLYTPGYQSWGSAQTNPWEYAPIHLAQLLSPSLAVTGWAPGCMNTLAGPARPQPPTATLLSYPGDGGQAPASAVYGERPFTPGELLGLPPGRSGPYLYVFAWGGDSEYANPLGWDSHSYGRIVSATVSGPDGPVPVRTVDNHTRTSVGRLNGYIPAGGMLIIPTPLRAGSAYLAEVVFQPDSGGAPLARRWSFTATAVDIPGGEQTDPGGRRPARAHPAVRLVWYPRSRRVRLVNWEGDRRGWFLVVERLPSQRRVRRTRLSSLEVTLPRPGARYRVCLVGEPAPTPGHRICRTVSYRSKPRIQIRGRRGRFGLSLALRCERPLAGRRATVKVNIRSRRGMSHKTLRLRLRSLVRVAIPAPPHARVRIRLEVSRFSRGDLLYGRLVYVHAY